MNAYTAKANKIFVWRVTEGVQLEVDNLLGETTASAVCREITVDSKEKKQNSTHTK